MTRTLSTILNANEADLRLQLGQLERLNGHNNSDIKLSVEVVQAARQKVHDLGLDAADTTAEELYHSLTQRVGADDQRLERALQTRAATYVSAEAKLMDGLVHALQAEARDVAAMAVKPAVLRRLLKATPPKKLLKLLHYRSLDAMLRQESPALLVAVASQTETAAWSKTWLDAYKKMSPSDFEARKAVILHPDTKKWQTVSQQLLQTSAHTLVSRPELGSIVVLPLPADRPKGMVVATVALALHDLNTIAATANYIKAIQVQPDFGCNVRQLAMKGVELQTPHLPQAMPWQLMQRYVSTTKVDVDQDILGPYVDASDFRWKHVESSLEKICPALGYWQGTAHLLYKGQDKTVSLNIVDAAINCCNRAAIESRSVYHAQQALWGELLLRYLDHTSAMQAMARLFTPQFAIESATN